MGGDWDIRDEVIMTETLLIVYALGGFYLTLVTKIILRKYYATLLSIGEWK